MTTCSRLSLCLLLLALVATAALARAAGQRYTNPTGMEFVLIPAGSFLMGSPESLRGARPNEKPQHSVTISKQFYLARYEVTRNQWEAVMGRSHFNVDRSNSFYNLLGMAARLGKPTNPATVSWNDAQVFIRRLNRMEGHTHYRLPTEAEWEYAARAGTTTAYSFGDDPEELGKYAWYGEDFASGSTHPVGQKLPNRWGLHDIHGNVCEWVQDWYEDAYFPRSPSVDPQGPTSGTGRVARGGCWHETSNSLRSAFHNKYEPDHRGIWIGFRVAMTVPVN